MTVHERLPNFLYIGPDKAGSSWLHERLSLHPDIFLSPAKDLYYFDRYFERGPQWYAQFFRHAAGEAIVGEVCQDYLFHPEAAARIASQLVDPRLMVTLRDPVERAFSSYLYARKHGIGPVTFRDALRSEPALLEHGRYATALERYLQVFKRERLLVTVFDDLQQNPQRLVDQVTDHLAIARMTLSEEETEPTLAAAQARAVPVAWALRRGADWVRAHDGAELIGAVKRSRLVHRLLYKPYGDQRPRPSDADVEYVRAALLDEVERLDQIFALGLVERWGWTT